MIYYRWSHSISRNGIQLFFESPIYGYGQNFPLPNPRENPILASDYKRLLVKMPAKSSIYKFDKVKNLVKKLILVITFCIYYDIKRHDRQIYIKSKK